MLFPPAAVAAAVGLLHPAAHLSDAAVPRYVDDRAAEWRLTAAEKLFDRIGWAADIRTARRLSAESNRPVFLFTMDGRVNTGRC